MGRLLRIFIIYHPIRASIVFSVYWKKGEGRLMHRHDAGDAGGGGFQVARDPLAQFDGFLDEAAQIIVRALYRLVYGAAEALHLGEGGNNGGVAAFWNALHDDGVAVLGE